MKSGYKQTEVGVIPEEWETRACSTLSERIMVGVVIRPTQYYVRQGVPAFRSANVREDGINNDDLVFISEASNRLLAKSETRTGDVLTVRTGYPGTSAVVGPSSAGCNCIDLIITRPSKKLNSAYLARWINSPFGKAQVLRNQGGLAQQHFNVGDMRNLVVALPPLPEQRAIAEALSDVDALLASLDRLIAKKRDLKQAAIQQLLTGQTRLPGFHGQWKVKTLGDLFTFSGGYSASRDQLSSEGHCYLHYGDIHTSSKSLIDASADYQDIPKLNVPLKRVASKSLLDDGDIVFVDASEDDAGASKHVVVVNKEKIPFIAGLHTIVAKSKTDELAHSYRRYCFQTDAIQQQFLFYAVGTKVTGISKTNIAKLKLPVPTVAEQTAIAVVLTDMDAEFAALEQRRNKTRDLKQAMMQELLTGRIRLVSEPANIVQFPAEKVAAAPPAKSHNWQINEAVVIAVLARHFGSEKFPLGRKRYTKLSYLLHRHVERTASGYLKKAAGPYNPATKYKGPEGIAQRNGYVRMHTNCQFVGFVAAGSIAKAEAYFQEWYGEDVLRWLEQFRRKTNDELELLTTVDMAMEDLRQTGTNLTLDSVKRVIHDHPEWEAKLSRPVFADANIMSAMNTCETILGSGA